MSDRTGRAVDTTPEQAGPAVDPTTQRPHEREASGDGRVRVVIETVTPEVDGGRSYTYFAWRNTTPNLWPNTPDILTEYLQAGGGARRSQPGWCWRQLSAPATGSTGPPSSWESASRGSPAARST